MSKFSAFTLIELLICIAIIAILSALSYPNYVSFITHTRRVEAIHTLINAQLIQSSHHLLHPSYTTDKSLLELMDTDYYQFSILSADETTYLLEAAAQKGSQQEKDTDSCITLRVDQDDNYSDKNEQPNPHCW
ncbi:pilus assembly protein [Psychromonas sp. CNPT3]|uniref:type IV pilin protein n=1 Tax=Psychromonas sp. CNPT3 TaxID=314282 RepID=UPI00006E5818|nr:type IV pilin protein [Psychromonas sp. CNPT3]AGH80433.1 pilus assembly protein [Psychromonas sp. CNPT3]